VTILSQLEKDLLDAASEHLARDATARRTRKRGRRTPNRTSAWPHLRGLGTTLSIALSIAVVMVVAVVALTALRHGHHPSSPAGVPSENTSRQELIQTLAVLRRPQTRAERDIDAMRLLGVPPGLERVAKGHGAVSSNARQYLARQGYPSVDRLLVRRLKLPGSTLTIVPITYQPSSRSPKRAEGLTIWLAVPGSPLEGLSPTSVATLRSQGANLFTYARDRNTGVVVVPDGVTKVTLERFRVTSPVIVDPADIPAVSSGVHNNVAAFHVNAPMVTTRGGLPGRGGPGMYSTGAYAHMTWYGAHGNVINRARTLLAFNFIVRVSRN
jgi:hypothetical protein